jgi:hypothetical protein
MTLKAEFLHFFFLILYKNRNSTYFLNECLWFSQFLTVFCEENLKKVLLASMRSIVKILLANLFRCLFRLSDSPLETIKMLLKPPVILKIVPKAGHFHWRKSTNESEVQLEQKFHAAFGTIFWPWTPVLKKVIEKISTTPNTGTYISTKYTAPKEIAKKNNKITFFLLNLNRKTGLHMQCTQYLS